MATQKYDDISLWLYLISIVAEVTRPGSNQYVDFDIFWRGQGNHCLGESKAGGQSTVVEASAELQTDGTSSNGVPGWLQVVHANLHLSVHNKTTS